MRFQAQGPALLHRQGFSVAPPPRQRPTAISQRQQRFLSRFLPPDGHQESICEHASSVEQECPVQPTYANEISGSTYGFTGVEASKKKQAVADVAKLIQQQGDAVLDKSTKSAWGNSLVQNSYICNW